MKLDNGMMYSLNQFRNTNAVHIKLTTRLGSNNDTVCGISHFLEHMLFTTNNRELIDFVETNGGVVSAYTTREFINIDISVQKNDFEKVLKKLHKIISLKKYDESDFNIEKRVILNECIRKRSNSNSAYRKILSKVTNVEELKPVIGEIMSIDKINLVDLEDYKNKYFTSEKMLLTICGDINIEDTRNTVKNLFSTLESGLKSRSIFDDLKLKSFRDMDIENQISLIQSNGVRFSLGFPCMNISERERVNISAIRYLFFSKEYPNSIFRKKFKRDELLNFSWKDEFQVGGELGMLLIDGQMTKTRLMEFKEIINRNINSPYNLLNSKEEIELVKNFIRNRMEIRLSSPSGLSQFIFSQFIINNEITNSKEMMSRYLKIIDEINAESLIKSFKKYIKNNEEWILYERKC